MTPKAFERTREFDPERFCNPPAIDRGAPFWAWNGHLEKGRLGEQLEVFKAMGLGGAHIHPRTGLETPYLGEDFMDLVETCARKNDELGNLTWLYDEDRWPSGFAGGLAVEDKAFRLRHLRITREAIPEGEAVPAPVHHGAPQPTRDRCWMASWALKFKGKLLESWRRLSSDTDMGGEGEILVHAYLEIPAAWTWFNNRQYIDTLNPAAMATFIEVTHEAYAERFSDRFGTSMPAIFTDEPLFRGMERPRSRDDERDRFIAWTGDLSQTYAECFGDDLWDVLPAVLFNTEEGSHHVARWRFHDHHTERFSKAFAGQLGHWCAEHGIALTGHMMAEATLQSQTEWIGDAMRSLQHFQLPGIDMLCDGFEWTTAKQAQSIARQTGAPGVMSELYGVTNWDFPFAGHKRQGDWQAALGVVTRVHHLSWYQMGGEAKRDYPASMGTHVPWWPEYPAVEDHFARLNAALKSGSPRCRVAMLHPIESFWLVHGPDADVLERQRLEKGFSDTLLWMLEGLVDVDLISEATLEDLAPIPTEPLFRVGEMAYEVVVIPPCLTMRRSTVKRLHAFANAGGRVLLTGEPPRRVHGEAVPLPETEAWERCPWQREALLDRLASVRDLTLIDNNGSLVDEVLSQQRDLPGGGRIVFVCNTSRVRSMRNCSLKLVGAWNPVLLDTDSGVESTVGASLDREGNTRVNVDLPIAGHVLLLCRPGVPEGSSGPAVRRAEIFRAKGPVSVTLEEDNVLLLDRGEWRLDEGPWNPAEEILRIDNLARKALGQGPRSGDVAQPWCNPKVQGEHSVTLRYRFTVEHPTGPLRVALEKLGDATLWLDGKALKGEDTGSWIDVAFRCTKLPALECGEHTLEIRWPFGGSEELEAAYLLGDFGVELRGLRGVLTAPVRELHWGSATEQGLPFYGGNLCYHLGFLNLPANAALEVAHFAGALVTADCDGARVGRITREPWSLNMDSAVSGEWTLTCWGTRINTFGQLHLVDERERWFGPASWRSVEERWSEGYRLQPTGILVEPRVTAQLP